ncbi:MAG: TonB-dependent receptor [Pseudoalteromonas distincta]|uniref:TonB-dependent receptor n=1 Tax=Pseudoalteromonas distincta TaxID=77608 RepID=UPI003F9D1603
MAGATIALSAGFTTTTYAAEEANKVERIEVTGSRIKRSDIEGPSPVQSIARADIENMGYDNLQQLLERMPVAGSGTFSTRGNNQDSTANGSAAVSLRGLGADATLVLINGRRVSISAFAEGITNSFVDINSIPVSAIERIDILKDGASAIYGSDAVAGVVNVILKKDIDGVEVNLGYGGTDGPNYEETTASLVWGTTSEKSSASVIIDYFKNTSLSSDEMGSLGTANQPPYGGEDFRSSRGFPGYFYVDGVKTIDPACPAENATSSGSCLFDYGPYGYIAPASERVGAISQFEYNFDNGITGFLEMAVQHNTSVAAGAPTPLDEDAGLTVPASHPNNPLDGTYNDPAVIDRITTSLVRRGESHMTSFDANITGEAFSFGDDVVMMAAGIEYREEDVNDIPDDQFQRGLIFGTESVSASADREQYAAYVEFSIPLADNLELQLAGRYDDYSDFGTTTNPKVALRWAPTDEITVRGSWAQGFRAPSLAQVGLGPSQESQFFVDTYRCEATGLDCDALDYNIEFAGNPDLEAEESESWNVGFIWAPSAEFGLSVDVWSITQDNKIDEQEFGPIYNSECNNQDSTVCVRLTPTGGDSLGTIQKIYSTFENVSSQEVSGVDVSANYNHSLDDLGLLKFNLEWAYQDKFEKDGRDYTGEYGYPEHRWIFSTNWEIGEFNTNVNISYVGEFEDTPDIDFDGNLDFDSNTSRMVDSQTLVDLQTSYRVTDSTKVSLGVNNLFDEEPPFAIGDGDADLYGYASGVHNPRGRYFYTKVSFSF